MSRNQQCLSWITRLLRGFLCLTLLLSAFAAPRALSIGSETCEEAEAYDSKLGKAERKRREEEARQKARTKLARRVLAEALADRWAPALTDEALEALRFRYRVDERLAEGTFYADGNKQKKEISFCVPRDLYRKVRADLKREREENAEALQQRFAQLERTIEAGKLDAASRELSSLKIDVASEELELTPYESVLTERTRPFYVWLFEWGDVVTQGPDYVRAMTDRATELVELGQLEEADRYVVEALKADPDNPEAHALRAAIQDRRNSRVDLLNEAEDLAEVGRFSAARRKIEQARGTGNDDPVPLETTAGTIDAMHAEYLQFNRPTTVSLYMAAGSLGADVGGIEDRVFDDTGFRSDGSMVLSFGATGGFRVGRFTMVNVSGSWGLSQDDARFIGDEAVELFEIYQLTASAGYRSPRSAKRKISFQVTGGPVWESVKVNTALPGTLSTSDSQLAFFVRVTAEWPTASFFVQHGLGFDDSPGTVVAWSNNLQVGAAVVF